MLQNVSFDIIIRIIDLIPNPFFVKDCEGRYIYCNEQFSNVIGRTKNEIIGKTVAELFPSQLCSVYIEKDAELVREGGIQVYESCVRNASGAMRDVIFYKTLLFDGSKKAGIAGTVTDITDLKNDLSSVAKSEELFRSMFEESPIGIELYDAHGKLVKLNDSCRDIFGVIDERDLEKFSLFDDPNIPPADMIKLKNNEIVHYKGMFSFDKVIESNLYRTCRKGGIFLDVLITPLLSKDNSEVSGYLVQVQDISDRQKAEDEMRHLSFHDKLTGLYNRAYFDNEIERFKIGRFSPLGIIVCDLDGLKHVNDKYGHAEGDNYLIRSAQAIQKSFRAGDIVARVGGDEFVCILPLCSYEVLNRSYDRIRENMSVFEAKYPMRISIGYSFRASADISIDFMLREADKNMYKDKSVRRA